MLTDGQVVALLACRDAETRQLKLSNAIWRGNMDAPPIMGTVIADLARGGLLKLSGFRDGRYRVAELTEHGVAVTARVIAAKLRCKEMKGRIAAQLGELEAELRVQLQEPA